MPETPWWPMILPALVAACADGTDTTVSVGPDASAPEATPVARGPDSGRPSVVADSGDIPTTGAGCGYQGRGTPLHVTADIDLCLPPVVCNSETCPPTLGRCDNGACVFQGSYRGLETQPEAWATYYCTLSTGGCHGVTQLEFPEVTAANIAQGMGLPLCEQAQGAGTCVGIAASSPMVVGNSQLAVDANGKQVSAWGLGLTEASGLCYELAGPGGAVVVALTDRCGGYCSCGGSGFQECGPCVNAPDLTPSCSCVGTVPGIYTECCGRGCSTTKQDCDWCASNNHPHFDLDIGAFNHLCGGDAGNGSCRLTHVKSVACAAPSGAWPPGGGGGGGCKTGSFGCAASAPHQVQVPGTNCCCNWDLQPQPDGTCR